jgi:hypothetical protein
MLETFEVMQVTPEIALSILTNKNCKNRNISKANLRNLTNAMLNGEWKLTNQGISFDRDGNLLDGQHRLQAIVESEVTCTMLVGKNMNPAIFNCIDTGKARTAGDTLDIAGSTNGKTIAAAVKMVSFYKDSPDHSWSTHYKPSHETIRQSYLLDQDLYEEAAITVRDKARQARHLLPASIVVAFYVLATHKGWPARKIDFFLDKVYIGASLKPDDVCLSFRNQLSAREYKRRGASSQRYLLNAFIKCFNINASHTPTERFRAPQDGSSMYQIKKYSPILELPS